MKVFIFEYASCFNVREFLLEGRLMLETLIDDFINKGFDVWTSSKYKTKAKNIEMKSLEDLENIKERDFDFFIFIAPNYELLKILEIFKNDERVLSPSYYNIKDVLDKYSFYKKLDGKFNVPKTFKYGKDKIFVPCVIKHRYGTGCEGLYFLKDMNDYKMIENELSENYLIQEFIKGIHSSVIVFSDGKCVLPISLNIQIIDEGLRPKYLGGILNINHPMKENIFSTIINLIRFLKLKYLIGVDLIISDKIYIIEINPRITTSMCFLKYISNINLAEVLIKCHEEKLDTLSYELSDRILFLKGLNGFRFLKF